MKKTIRYECPHCEGIGQKSVEVDYPEQAIIDKEALAKVMRASGATLEQIKLAIGVKSLSTVDYYLKK